MGTIITPNIYTRTLVYNPSIYGVIRNTGSGWAFINDVGHKPYGLGSISVMSDRIRIYYSAAGTTVGTFTANVDETFAAQGLRCGTSVGTAWADVLLYTEPADRITDYVSHNGTSWSSLNDVFGGFSYSSGVLTLTHQAMGAAAHAGVALANRGTVAALAGSYSDASTQVAFYTGSYGSLVAAAAPTTSTTHRVHVTRFGKRAAPAADPTTVVSATGNIWLHGIMQ